MSEPTRADFPDRRRRTLAAFLFPTVLFTAGIAAAQEKVDLDTANRIRDTALNHSQIVEMVGYLTDVIGPRLTGSPNLKRAEEYARDKLHEWGLENAHLEAWGPFGRGWSLEGFTANVLSPRFSPLIAYPKAWSPGTNGIVRGEVVFLDAKTVADLDKYKGKLKGVRLPKPMKYWVSTWVLVASRGYPCIFVPDLIVQASIHSEPEEERQSSSRCSVAVLVRRGLGLDSEP